MDRAMDKAVDWEMDGTHSDPTSLGSQLLALTQLSGALMAVIVITGVAVRRSDLVVRVLFG